MKSNDSEKTFFSPTNLTDETLFQLCKKYGTQAKLWRQKFIGLLPEVHKRKLYERKGFYSIFEFAAKLAGLSQEQVRRVLNIEQRLEQTPELQKLLTSGEISMNKLARVVSIATPENEQILVNQIRILSKNALETLVRDEKTFKLQEENLENSKGKNGLQKGLFDDKSVPGHNFQFNFTKETLATRPILTIDQDVQEKLLKLQEKGININQLLRELLNKHESEIEQVKQELAQEIEVNQHNKKELKEANNRLKIQKPPKPSRYIPIKIKKIIQLEHGTKCSISTCHKPAEIIHHTQRFALSQNHNPNFLAQMCKQHHEIAHSIDLKVQQKRWRP